MQFVNFANNSLQFIADYSGNISLLVLWLMIITDALKQTAFVKLQLCFDTLNRY